MELLPAPFGPMIARISCARTSKLMSVNAFTPPNDSEMLSSFSMTSPISRSPVAMARQAAFCADAAGNVFAFSMRRSAATTPVRPSSNFTRVSMC